MGPENDMLKEALKVVVRPCRSPACNSTSVRSKCKVSLVGEAPLCKKYRKLDLLIHGGWYTVDPPPPNPSSPLT